MGSTALSLVLFNQMGQTRKTYSLNTKRKYFHFLALTMFIPGYLYEVSILKKKNAYIYHKSNID